MSRTRITVIGTTCLRPGLLLFACMLTACGQGRAPTAPDSPTDGRLQWQGVLACADCDGIRTDVQLTRQGGESDFTLMETYLSRSGDQRFVDHGSWQRERDLLRLRGESSVRVFALLPDGRLQPRDVHGNAFAPRENDFLQPVTGADAP